MDQYFLYYVQRRASDWEKCTTAGGGGGDKYQLCIGGTPLITFVVPYRLLVPTFAVVILAYILLRNREVRNDRLNQVMMLQYPCLGLPDYLT